MKRLWIGFVGLMLAVSAMAVPAHKSWNTYQQADGSSIELMLVGDEHFHYFITRDEVVVVESSEGFVYAQVADNDLKATRVLAHAAAARQASELRYCQRVADVRPVEQLRRAAARKAVANKLRQRRAKAAGGVARIGAYKNYEGAKKGLIILAQFSDKTFASPDEAQAYYADMANAEGFSDNGAPGSVHDYFADVSRGKFNLTFDVVGPVTLSKKATYYGGISDGNGSPYQGVRYADEMVKEACTLADEAYEINWADYDWDGDGEVEEVFIYYAGYGQATGGQQGTVWPHMGWLSEDFGDEKLEFGGMKVDVYACANELYGRSGSRKMGLGTFCHEFSHCLGFPDMYDTSYSGNYGMGDFDIMDSGNYNDGNGGLAWCPAGYTSWERYMAGWLELDELQPNDTIRGMRPIMEDGAHAYVVYNDAFKDEYYLIENRSQISWDAHIPHQGVTITHVDYDEALFADNIVNTEVTAREARTYGYAGANDHERMTMFKLMSSSYSYFSSPTLIDGTYPLTNATRTSVVDSLTDNSTPKAILYNNGPDGTKLMHKPIYDISYDAATQDASFVFMPRKADEDSNVVDGIRRIAAGLPSQPADPVTVYSLNGIRIAEAAQLADMALPRGVYIVQRGSEKQKVVIK